jgi:amidase
MALQKMEVPMPDTIMDGLALAELVAIGQATPTELLDAAIERANRVNPAINAITVPLFDAARAQIGAGLPNGPYRGVPFLLKDIGATLAGVPTSAGSRLFADQPAAHDSEVTRRLKHVGLVIFGKTNTPEFGSLPTTEPLLTGTTRNPWSLAHSAGGSSGGSAAAIAAGIVPAAHGTDGAGSIRIPASCCGLVGMKPTRARITGAPDVGESIGGISSQGVLSLTVRDSAALLDALQGPAPGDPYYAEPPLTPYLASLETPLRRLKIAVTWHSMIGTILHQDCIDATDHAAKLCEAQGHTLIEDAPPLDGEVFYRLYRRFWPLSAARSIHRVDRQRGHPGAVDETEPFNQYLFEVSRGVSALDYILDLQWFHAATRAFGNWFATKGYDAWLTPTLGLPPPELGFFDAAIHGGSTVLDRFIAFLPFTPFANMTGQPAISLPLFWNAEGLPIGSQFFAPFGDETTLFQLAHELEMAQPWADRRPRVYA